MSLSTVSATVQDPSGQVFANGTWQLVFKPTPNTPGLFTDSGVPFITLFGGALDNTGSFSQAGVARNDTIAPAGSKWSLIVSPNANGQAYSIDLNINNGAFNASAAINAIITNVAVQATTVAHAYKDAEVIPVPGSGGIYFDVTNKVLKTWDVINQVWITVNASVQLPITKIAVASNWLRSYDATTGLFTASQPTYGDISGTPQLPITLGAVASNWLRSYNSVTGLFAASQPASSDLSDVAVLTTLTGVQTLTNKRVTPRQVVMADAANVTPTSDTADINTFTSTQVAGTLTINAPTGTPTDGQKLVLRLKSTNAQTYSFNATYAFSTTVTAPVTLAAGKTDYIGLMWNATNTKWDVVAVDQGH